VPVADNQDNLELKIVLDDGQVVQGFLNLQRTAKAASADIGRNLGDKRGGALSSFNDELLTTSLRFGVLTAAVATLGTVIKKSFDFALLGESTKAINQQFKTLANQAGIAADELQKGIEAAAGGLIDDEDALKIATQSIIALGDAAKNLPSVLNLARSVSNTLGKDFKETFGDLSLFIENGNAKLLRQYGILLDTKPAIDQYARSLGISADQLSNNQLQVIRLNTLLEQAGEKFRNGAQSVTPFKDSLDRLKVSFGNLQEAAAVRFVDQFGGGLSRVADKLTDITKNGLSVKDALSIAFQGVGGFLGRASQAADDFYNLSLDEIRKKTSEVTDEIKKLNDELRSLEKTQSETKNIGTLGRIAGAIPITRNKIKELQGDLDQLFKVFNEKQPSPLAPFVPETPKPDDAVGAAIFNAQKARSLELTSFLQSQLQVRLQAEQLAVNDLSAIEKQKSDILLNNQLQYQNLELQHQQKLLEIENKFSNDKFFNQAQRDQAIFAATLAFDAQVEQQKRAQAAKLKAIEDQQNFDSLSGYQTILEGFDIFAKSFADAADQFAASAVASLQSVGKQAFNSLGSGVGRAFSAFGAALKKGEAAGSAFEKAIVATFGDIAVQLGTYYITLGLAKLFATPKEQAEAPALIAAGAALATLGGVLGATQSAPSESGGGIASTTTPTTDLVPENELTRAEPNTNIDITIEGSVYDSEETGARIVDLINSAFDKKGVVINRNAVT
jgi:hypothetical protein